MRWKCERAMSKTTPRFQLVSAVIVHRLTLIGISSGVTYQESTYGPRKVDR